MEARDKHENNVNDDHTRLKYVSGSCIKKKAQDDYNGNVMNIYKDLFDGKEIEFDLTDRLDNKDVFEFDQKTLKVSTRRTKFPREIKFDLHIERL